MTPQKDCSSTETRPWSRGVRAWIRPLERLAGLGLLVSAALLTGCSNDTCHEVSGDTGESATPTTLHEPTPNPTVDVDHDGYTPEDGDCDDTNPNVHPAPIEGPEPDGLDNDCDGEIDENSPYVDQDGDGYARTDGDCDDTNPDIYPGQVEYVDQIDNDCDGMVDESETDLAGSPAGDATVLGPNDAWANIARGPQRSMVFDIAFLRDLDGDGYDELAVSTFDGDGQGRVFLVYGGPDVVTPPAEGGDTWADIADAVFEGVGEPNLTGTRVLSGDLDGDGQPDLVIGDIAHQRVSVYRGGERFSGTYDARDDATATFMPVTSGAYNVGYSVDIPGDINGDGFPDLLIGQPSFDNARGRVLIFFGGRAFQDLVELDDADAIIEGDAQLDYTGAVVSGIGDADGDGLADFLVTSPNDWNKEAGVYYGTTYLYYGSPDGFAGPLNIADAPVAIHADNWMMGFQTSHGDFDGDGFSDFVTSQPLDGCAAIVYGGETRLSGEGFIGEFAGTWVCKPVNEDVVFGGSVALGSDLDGDGFADLAITNGWHYLFQIYMCGWFINYVFIPYPGYAAVIPGRPGRPETLDVNGPGTAMIRGEEGKMWFVLPVATGGDFDGDGLDDLAVGAETYYEVDPDAFTATNHTFLYSDLPLNE